jgi:hypothetical protein
VPKRHSKRLVIDASIARSSGGEDATYPTSKNCRDFLTATLDICHQIVMTADILEEWNAHQSRFARRWRVSMEARKKVYRLDCEADEALRHKIKQFVPADKHYEAMIKDCHLIEAAILTDKIIVSLDDIARDLFTTITVKVGEFRNLVWVNPDNIEDEQPILWLEQGAKTEKKRQLGFRIRDG